MNDERFSVCGSGVPLEAKQREWIALAEMSIKLERLYRDSRCGALMLPWTAELCLDRIGREALYEPGESDD